MFKIKSSESEPSCPPCFSYVWLLSGRTKYNFFFVVVAFFTVCVLLIWEILVSFQRFPSLQPKQNKKNRTKGTFQIKVLSGKGTDGRKEATITIVWTGWENETFPGKKVRKWPRHMSDIQQKFIFSQLILVFLHFSLDGHRSSSSVLPTLLLWSHWSWKGSVHYVTRLLIIDKGGGVSVTSCLWKLVDVS